MKKDLQKKQYIEMKKLIYLLFVVLLTMTFCGCQSLEEQQQETDAEINQAMLQGREAARILVGKEWKDTMQLQNHILEAKAKQSRYLIENKPKSAQAFDYGFVSLIKNIRPELANSIFPDSLLLNQKKE